jgi:peptidoglycan/xylan/chitin deacetylase (PgdA/CDA1 family)
MRNCKSIKYQHHPHKRNEKFLLAKRSEDVLIDLELSRMLLNTRYFAYPFGQYDKNTIRLLKEAGY